MFFGRLKVRINFGLADPWRVAVVAAHHHCRGILLTPGNEKKCDDNHDSHSIASWVAAAALPDTSQECVLDSWDRFLKETLKKPLAAQQLRHFRYIHSNAPRLEGQHASDVSLVGCIARVDVEERLTVRIQHLEASGRLLDLPRRRKAA